MRCSVSILIVGQGDLRKGGDFEAQRHWMEIAVNTPVKEWYIQTETNDLAWWGLDYPPLSAYWAYATGKLAAKVNPAFVELYKSRRLEKDGIKEFMRATVMLCDLMILIPAFLLFANNRSYSVIMVLWTLLNPSLVLTDHGHFQYNTVMLGLMVLAVVMLLDYKKQVVATALVCLSVCFKQMGLYYIPVFFFFLLRQCIRHRGKYHTHTAAHD